MNDFSRRRRFEHRHERTQTVAVERVDAPDPLARRDLQYAQAGKEGALAQKLRIQPDPRLRGEGGAEFRELLAAINPNSIRHCCDPRVKWRSGLSP